MEKTATRETLRSKYDVNWESPLGEGSFGVVYLGIDKATGEKVAIKKMSPFEHQTYCQRTLREVKILTRLKHENIIELLDIVCEDQIEKLKVSNSNFMI